MVERIIPIQIEGTEEVVVCSDATEKVEPEENCVKSYAKIVSSSSNEKDIPKIQPKKQIRIKPASEDKYLAKFAMFEKRSDFCWDIPNADTPEKIVLVIDRGQDDEFSPFASNTMSYSPLSMVKRAVNIFISLKHAINSLHEFAIVVLNENNASLLLNFTSELRKLRDCINKITECKTEDILNINSVFEIIKDIADLPSSVAEEIEPAYVLRTVIFYGRSYTIPQLEVTEEVNAYLTNKYFTCDVLMTHEPIEISNHCDKIFGILQKLDTKGIAYFFPVGRDIRKLHKCTNRLLAHPLQRPIQKLCAAE